jgi:peptide/nickel transport system substrate-binding protein
MEPMGSEAMTIIRSTAISRRSFNSLALSGLAASTLAAPFVRRAYADTRKTLIFGSGEPVTASFDPTSHTSLAQINLEGFIFGQLFRTPMRPEKPDELVWELATGQKIVDNFTIEYSLRDGVKFHDGADFSAEDVKASLEYASQPSRPATWYPGPVEVQVVDRLTARVSTKPGGYPASALYFLMGFLPIMAKGDVADPKRLQGRPNGTGPFQFARQESNSTVLKAYDGFQNGRPLLDELRFNYIGDATTRVLGLLGGEIDIIERLEPEQYETLAADNRVKTHRTISTENKYLHFRCNKPPFDNPVMRRAVAYAIDRQQIMDVMGVAGHPSSNYISPLKFGYADLPDYPTFDAAKCQELLNEAGYPKGQGLPELEYLVGTGFYPKTKEYGEVITAMLQEQGIPVKLTVLEVAAWVEKIYQQKEGVPHDNMVDVGWSTGSPEPDLVLRSMFYGSAGPQGGLINGIKDKEIDEALDRERGTADPEERKKIIQTVTTPKIAEKLPSFSLFTSVNLHATKGSLGGLYFYPNGPMDVTKAEYSAT